MTYMRDIDGYRLDQLAVKTGLEASLRRLTTIAYAEDVANASLPLGAGLFTQLPLTFSIPPTDLDVTLSWGGSLTITAAGNGGITVAPCDVTAGTAPAAFTSVSGTRVGGFLTGTFSVGPTHQGETNIGPSVSWRIYRLYGFVGRDAGSVLAASYRASGNPPILKTFMKAVTG